MRWRNMARLVRGLHRDDAGALATEYLLILALVVIPIAAMLPLFLRMISRYSFRILDMVRIPFP